MLFGAILVCVQVLNYIKKLLKFGTNELDFNMQMTRKQDRL